MNYLAILESLLERGKQRIKIKGDFLHKHRIIPGYAGGKYEKENISFLTRKEHKIVHYIQYKIHKDPRDLLAASKLGLRISDKQYYAVVSRSGTDNLFFGRKHSKKTKDLMRKAKLGLRGIETNHFGKKHSVESRKKIANSTKLRFEKEEERQKIAESVRNLNKKYCRYCKGWFKPAGFGHWHGDRCKSKQSTDQ